MQARKIEENCKRAVRGRPLPPFPISLLYVFHLPQLASCLKSSSTSFPGSSLFLPRESTLVSAGHVSRLSKQLPTRVDLLFFKKRREKRMQIFSNSHEHRGMEVITSLFFKDRDAEKIYSLLSAAFQNHK